MDVGQWVRLIMFAALFLLGVTAGAQAAESGTFSGTWSASGTRESMDFGSEREVALLKFSGHVNLRDGVGSHVDYWARCIGLGDTGTGSAIRCIWRSLEGQELYVALRAEQMAQGAQVSGEIVGGSGELTGITGTLSFQWSTLSLQRNGNILAVGGYAKELQGTYTLP